MKTVMERSKIALHKWLQAFHLMCSSKKGVRAHQLHRQMDMTYEAAWFMAHRIREAMRAGGWHQWAAAAKSSKPMKPTMATSIIRVYRPNKTKGRLIEGFNRKEGNKRPIVALGRARRQRPHVSCSSRDVKRNCSPRRGGITLTVELRLHTDESRLYWQCWSRNLTRTNLSNTAERICSL